MTEKKGDKKILYACRLTEREDRQVDTQDDRETGRQEDTVCMQVDRERIDSQTLRMTEKKGDKKILYACRLTEGGLTVGHLG